MFNLQKTTEFFGETNDVLINHIDESEVVREKLLEAVDKVKAFRQNKHKKYKAGTKPSLKIISPENLQSVNFSGLSVRVSTTVVFRYCGRFLGART